MKLNLLNKTSGFGLIEIIVSIALLGIVSVGVMNLIQSSSKQQKSFQAKDQQRDFTFDVRTILSHPDACKNTFEAKIIPTVVTEIKDKTNAVIYSVDQLDRSKLLQIKSIKLENFLLRSTNIANTEDEGRAELRVFVAKNSAENSNELLNPDVIILKITKDHVTNTILKCSTLDSTNTDAALSLWKKSIANPNDIYFNTGNVGVNMINPSYKFQVAGDLALSSPTQMIKANIIDAVDSSQNANIFQTAQGKIYLSGGNNFVIDPVTSKVGIGTANPKTKLDINGQIKIGANTTSVCNSVLEGAQKYDFAEKCMSFCNGTSWICMKIKKPKDCIGTWSSCDSVTGKKTYIIAVTEETGGTSCSPNFSGETTTTGCSSASSGLTTSAPTVCAGQWSACAGGSQIYTITSQPSGVTCAPANGQSQFCGTVNPTYSCNAGWNASGSVCSASATATDDTITTGGETGQECWDSSGPAPDGASCTGGYGWVQTTTPTQTSTTTTYSCDSGGNLNGMQCEMPAAAACPAHHPNLSNTTPQLCGI